MMIINIPVLRCLFIFNMVASCYGFSIDFLSSEVFILPLTHENFSLPTAGVEFRPSLLNMPDLPSWLHYTYSFAAHSGFIYGAPPEGIKDIKLEVVATDKLTYNTSRKVFELNIKPQPTRQNEVRFKITNLNIDELLVGNSCEKLRIILVEDLWPDSANDGIITSLFSATHKGDRLPLMPDDKEGVYVSYGSSASFSTMLYELEIEVKPLWNHRPCPKYFKKTKYERYFRQKGIAVDWCNFKLQSNDLKSFNVADSERNAAIISTHENPPIKLMKMAEIGSRSYVFDVIYTILIPLLVMLVLLGLLTLAMCCHRANIPRMPTHQDIQMVQYASINKALGALHKVQSLKDGRDHSPHPSMATTTTQVDTLPRSRTGSLSSTLPRHSTPSRRFEDYETLSRPDPPPYQRNGSTPTR